MAKYALIIGIGQYEHFSNLPKAATDAEAIAQLLEQHAYNVTRLPRKLVGENQWAIDREGKLKSAELNREIKSFLRERANKQEAVIYFAGHGFRVTNPTTDGIEAYLATSDSTKEGLSSVQLGDLNVLISRSNLSSLVMLLDCCYAGSLIDQRSLLQPVQSTISQKQNYCLIAACRNFERAREGDQHGIFTAAVLRGLLPENAVQGKITSSDLFGFISRELETSGQEIIHAGMGRAIQLVRYSTHNLVSTDITVDETCPYQGLKPFDKSTAKFFFGREQVVRQLVEKLEQSAFIALIGASGSGKSSIVRAGLIPELEKNNWHILNVIQPGVEPIAKLKAALEQLFRDQDQLDVFSEIHVQFENEGLCSVIEYLINSGRVLGSMSPF
jgi:ABC-type multidrug transport system fused ATPase/permease subunit